MSILEILPALVITNIVSVMLLVVCYKWPRVGRAAWCIVFFAAAVVNIVTAITDPASYVWGFATYAHPIYRTFIFGWFSDHVRLVVILIAVGQAIIAVLLWQRGGTVKLGIVGAIVFLFAITPLKFGAGFPAPLLMALAVSLLWDYRFESSLFQWNKLLSPSENRS